MGIRKPETMNELESEEAGVKVREREREGEGEREEKIKINHLNHSFHIKKQISADLKEAILEVMDPSKRGLIIFTLGGWKG